MENLMDIYVRKNQNKNKTEVLSGRIITDEKNHFEGIVGDEGNYQLVFGEITSEGKETIIQLSQPDNKESTISSINYKCEKLPGRIISGFGDNSGITLSPADLTRTVTQSEIIYVEKETRMATKSLKKPYIK